MTRKHSFPAGEYYIGDPCYVVEQDKDWDELIENTGVFGIYTENPKTHKPYPNWDDGCYQYKGKTCFAHGTALGDGLYSSQIGIHPVDAGMLSIVPIEAVDKFHPRDGVLHKFDEPFDVYEKNGVFHFGWIKINTK